MGNLALGELGVIGFMPRRDAPWGVRREHIPDLGALDYSRLNRVQNSAIALLAEISEIGSNAWDTTIRNNRISFESRGWKPIENYYWQKMADWWKGQVKSLIATPGREPSDADVNTVEVNIGGTKNMLTLIKSLPPANEKAREAEAWARSVEAKLSKTTLKSPTEEAKKAFIEDLTKRTKGLFGISLGVIGIAAIVGGVIFLKKK